MRRQILVLAAVFAFLCTAYSQADITYKLIDLGALGGDYYSGAKSINNIGQIVGWSKFDPNNISTRATLFDSTGAGNNIDLGTLGGSDSFANCINDVGQIVGQEGGHATLFDPTGEGNNVDLGRGVAFSINYTGQIVGWAVDSEGWTLATLFDHTGTGNNIHLGTLGGDYSCAYSINDAGQVVGSARYTLPGRTNHATLFDNTGSGNNIDLGGLTTASSIARSINNLGQIVGYSHSGTGYRLSHAVLFDTKGNWNNVDLGTLDGNQSFAHIINDVGQIVGDATNANGDSRATLFDPTGGGNNIDLNDLIDPNSHWTLTSANDINNNGWIVGQGINPQGECHAFLLVPSSTKYSGGTGEPNDPYQIATAEDLILLGETPEDYDKHFIMTADIDLDPNLSGRKVFDRAVIAPDINDREDNFQGTSFAGFFNGNDHTISHLTITGMSSVGLFGQLDSGAIVSNLGLELVGVNGIHTRVGSLASRNYGSISRSYSTGIVSGDDRVGGLVGGNGGSINMSYSNAKVNGKTMVGGLVGVNGHEGGRITKSYSTGVITGTESVGGLVGNNSSSVTASYSNGTLSGEISVGGLVGINATDAHINTSYSTSTVSGESSVGGLVGSSNGSITASSSTGSVSGNSDVGGLVGLNSWSGSITSSYSIAPTNGDKGVGGFVGENCGVITTSYSTGMVTGNEDTGGLVGSNRNIITKSFWDIETSGQTTSADVTGLTTVEMQDINTFLKAGWDFVDETQNGTCDYWQILPDDYPVLFYHPGYCPVMPEGFGTAEEPYLIRDARDLGTVWFKPMAHYRLETSIDLSMITWSKAVIPWLGGRFDGNGHTIFYLTIEGQSYLGLCGQLGSEANVLNLGMEAIYVNGIGDLIGGLAGVNDGSITSSYCTGTVNGTNRVGGLVGYNNGEITTSYNATAVNGTGWAVGGLVGHNDYGSIATSYNVGMVTGADLVGGLVGTNWNSITMSYNNGTVIGTDSYIGGLVGENFASGDFDACSTITMSYSTGPVSGPEKAVGGLVGRRIPRGRGGGLGGSGSTSMSFWDIESSGLTTSNGGTGKTTSEMQMATTFATWGSCDNEGTWVIDEGQDYPRLWWQDSPGEPIAVGSTVSEFLAGAGTKDDPYLIYEADELNLLGLFSCDWDKHFRLMTNIDLSVYSYQSAVIAGQDFPEMPFSGSFDGNGHTISHLTIVGESYLGLFGRLGSEGRIFNLGLEATDVNGTGWGIGGLVGFNQGGSINMSYCIGTINGENSVGGLVGDNHGDITMSYSRSAVNGNSFVGGIAGSNLGSITASFSTGMVNGDNIIGGLVGYNQSNGIITWSYSTSTVMGDEDVGGLVGGIWPGSITESYSTGQVTGNSNVGGLVGSDYRGEGSVTSSFWDIESSQQTSSAGGTDLTTAEMQTATTFLDTGWDFVDETTNGTDDIWWILEGRDYPRLWWEAAE